MRYQRTAPNRRSRGELFGFGQKMRARPTSGEAALWESLNHNQLGVSVRRQHPVLGYIADFYIPQWAVVIEIDGSSHDNPESKTYDTRRDRRMLHAGITVVRIPDDDAFENPLGTLEKILLTLLGQ